MMGGEKRLRAVGGELFLDPEPSCYCGCFTQEWHTEVHRGGKTEHTAAQSNQRLQQPELLKDRVCKGETKSQSEPAGSPLCTVKHSQQMHVGEFECRCSVIWSKVSKKSPMSSYTLKINLG